jgi:hypothetical protein
MKRSIKFLVIFTILSVFISCNDDDSDPAPPAHIIVTFNADLDGTSEVPPVTTTSADGTAVLKFDKTTKIFTLQVMYTGLVVTDAHVHKGAVGVDGGIVFPITDLSSPMDYTSRPLTAAEEADLFANLYYVNLHTAAFPGGEIRGQLITTNPSGTGGGGGGGGTY